MKRGVVLVTMLCILSLNAAPRHRTIEYTYKVLKGRGPVGRRKPGLNETTKAILSRFAAIIMSFFGILQNPNDSANVTANVTNMITNTVSMIAEAVKSGKLSLDADCVVTYDK
jgi:hypothetical protein